MKIAIKLVAAGALLVVLQAQAEIIGYVRNQGGGKINLLAEKGTCKTGRMVIAASPGREADFGCWMYDAEQIFVQYETGQMHVYPAENVHMTKEKQPAKNRKDDGL